MGLDVRRANHVALSVSDMERSLAFYAGALGLELVGRNPTVERIPGFPTVVALPGMRAEWALLRVGADLHLELMCYSEPAGRPLRPDHVPADLGPAHLALEVDDVHAAWDELVGLGLPVVSSPVDLGRHTTFFVPGPDGELVEILEERGPLLPGWQA